MRDKNSTGRNPDLVIPGENPDENPDENPELSGSTSVPFVGVAAVFGLVAALVL